MYVPWREKDLKNSSPRYRWLRDNSFDVLFHHLRPACISTLCSNPPFCADSSVPFSWVFPPHFPALCALKIFATPLSQSYLEFSFRGLIILLGLCPAERKRERQAFWPDSYNKVQQQLLDGLYLVERFVGAGPRSFQSVFLSYNCEQTSFCCVWWSLRLKLFFKVFLGHCLYLILTNSRTKTPKSQIANSHKSIRRLLTLFWDGRFSQMFVQKVVLAEKQTQSFLSYKFVVFFFSFFCFSHLNDFFENHCAEFPSSRMFPFLTNTSVVVFVDRQHRIHPHISSLVS